MLEGFTKCPWLSCVTAHGVKGLERSDGLPEHGTGQGQRLSFTKGRQG